MAAAALQVGCCCGQIQTFYIYYVDIFCKSKDRNVVRINLDDA